MENLENKIGLKCCKWSTLNAPGFLENEKYGKSRLIFIPGELTEIANQYQSLIHI